MDLPFGIQRMRDERTKEGKKERKRELGALGADGDVIMIRFGGGGRIVVEVGKEVLVFDGFML